MARDSRTGSVGETGVLEMLELDTARQFRAAGLSCFPVRTDGSKAPALAGWREYSERPPDEAELLDWFTPPNRHGIGVPGGPASGNLLILDFEARDAFTRWCGFLTDEDRRYLAGSPVVASPGGGNHVYLRLVEPVKGTKYARTAEGECLIETRGNGQYVVAPGSPAKCHPTNRPYQFLRRGWIDGTPFEPIPLDVFHGLTVYAAELNEYTRPAAREVVGDRGRVGEVGDRPGDHFNARVGWGDILGPAGWRVFRSTSSATYWTRPGKDSGVSASTGHCRGPSGHDLLYVFSTSAAPFEAERSYSRFGAYVLLSHHGDFASATRTLGNAGYGKPRRRAARPVWGVRP